VFQEFFQKAPELKSPREIGLMRDAGKIVAEALAMCREMARPGVRSIEINAAVEALFARHGARPLFKNYTIPKVPVPFPASTCISFNEQVVHGIPGQREIRDGDLVKIDTACKLNGWCADAAITVQVGNVRPERRRLVEAGEQVLRIAIEEMGRRRWWSEVASHMQRFAEGTGFAVVRNYVGHGIGRTMHENPQVPNYVSREMKKQDFRLEEGLVLAVEPMLNMGRGDIRVLATDHWTVVTVDSMPSVHVEHTLAITRNGVVIVTA
jgi:methionyl aminopeptidase